MARDITWDFLLGAYEGEDVNFLEDRVLKISPVDGIVREKILEWGKKLYGFSYSVDVTGRILSCGSLYSMRKFDSIKQDYEKVL
jgi:hypothetical protein